MMRSSYLMIGAVALTIAATGAAFADEDPHARHRAMAKQSADRAAESADIDLRDRTLIDQDGREVRFVSDVIGDRISQVRERRDR
jgi:hypothetical protein